MNCKVAVTVLLALAACTTHEQREPADLSNVYVEHSEAVRAWRVLEGPNMLGFVVQFADPEDPDDQSRRFFSVRNPFQQELGMIDGLGRVWRFQPHQREAQLLGSGTVAEGARRILGASDSATLFEAPLSDLRAAPAPAGG